MFEQVQSGLCCWRPWSAFRPKLGWAMITLLGQCPKQRGQTRQQPQSLKCLDGTTLSPWSFSGKWRTTCWGRGWPFQQQMRPNTAMSLMWENSQGVYLGHTLPASCTSFHRGGNEWDWRIRKQTNGSPHSPNTCQLLKQADGQKRAGNFLALSGIQARRNAVTSTVSSPTSSRY